MSHFSCCYGCIPPKRSVLCHSTCSDYISECTAHNVLHEKISSERLKQGEISGYIKSARAKSSRTGNINYNAGLKSR